MQEPAVFVIVEVVSVKDPEGLRTYAQRASKLIGAWGESWSHKSESPSAGNPVFILS
jgi:hypothetical protein